MCFSAVYVVSPEVLLRHSLACLLSAFSGYKKVAEADNAQDVMVKEKNINNCILILDAGLPETEISRMIEFAKRGKNKVIIMGCGADRKRLVSLIPLKADGYLTTKLAPEEFFNLLGQVVQTEEPVIDTSLFPEMVDRLSDESVAVMKAETVVNLLTPREMDILRLLASGHTNGQISEKLFISVYTVKNHVHNILEKLGIENRTRLASYALTRGLVG